MVEIDWQHCPMRRLFLGLPVWLVLVAYASAQESAVQYIEYPQILGKEQPLQLSGVPRWATFDGQLRARMENQTSDDYISGNDQAYVLTRIYGGMGSSVGASDRLYPVHRY